MKILKKQNKYKNKNSRKKTLKSRKSIRKQIRRQSKRQSKRKSRKIRKIRKTKKLNKNLRKNFFYGGNPTDFKIFINKLLNDKNCRGGKESVDKKRTRLYIKSLIQLNHLKKIEKPEDIEYINFNKTEFQEKYDLEILNNINIEKPHEDEKKKYLRKFIILIYFFSFLKDFQDFFEVSVKKIKAAKVFLNLKINSKIKKFINYNELFEEIETKKLHIVSYFDYLIEIIKNIVNLDNLEDIEYVIKIEFWNYVVNSVNKYYNKSIISVYKLKENIIKFLKFLNEYTTTNNELLNKIFFDEFKTGIDRINEYIVTQDTQNELTQHLIEIIKKNLYLQI